MGKNTTEDGVFDQAVASLDGILRSRSPGKRTAHPSRRSWRPGLVVPILIVMLGIAALAAVGVDGARRWATRSLRSGSGLFGERVTVSLPPADRAVRAPMGDHAVAVRVMPAPVAGVPAGTDQPAPPTPTPVPAVRTVAAAAAVPAAASGNVRQRRRRMTAASFPPHDPAEQADNDNEDEANATTKREADEAERRAAIDAIRALRLR